MNNITIEKISRGHIANIMLVAFQGQEEKIGLGEFVIINVRHWVFYATKRERSNALSHMS